LSTKENFSLHLPAKRGNGTSGIFAKPQIRN
jgi:hypothetical protein